MAETYSAIQVSQFGGPEVLELHSLPIPVPGDGQVLVRVHAVGVNPVDTYIRKGIYGRLPTLPYTPGTDGAGVIEKLGPNANKFKVGDRVYLAGTLTGSYAQLAVAHECSVHRLSDKLTFEQGASLFVPYGTAFRALFQSVNPAKPGEWLLIHGGSGGVGVAAIQLARAGGLKVIATAGTDEGLKLVKELGAHHALNHSSPDYLNEVFKLTENKGVDYILEMLANVNLGKDLTVLSTFGRVGIIGSRGAVEINPRDLMSRDAVVFGVALMNTPPEKFKQIHEGLIKAADEGVINPVIGQVLPLKDAPVAHDRIINSKAHGKIILKP